VSAYQPGKEDLFASHSVMSKVSFTRQVVRGGFKAFEAFAMAEKARYDQSPAILIASQPDESIKPSDKKPYHELIETTSKQMELLLRNKLRLQTVTTRTTQHAAAAYAFPTLSDVQEVSALANRVGAATIVATGTGVAMDLAKAVTASNSDVDHLVLCPTTLGGTLASSTSQALLLDHLEEALVLHSSGLEARSVDTVVAQLNNVDSVLNKGYKQKAILSCLTIALDCLYRVSKELSVSPNRSIDAILEQAKNLLTDTDSATFTELSDLCFEAGGLLSYGLEGESRSVPLSLAASLFPNSSWGQYDTTTLWAGLAPTFCEIMTSRNPSLGVPLSLPQAPSVVTNESMEALLSHIHANQALWNCLDCSDEQLVAILRKHVLLVHE